MIAEEVIDGAYLALLPSAGRIGGLQRLPDRLPQGIEWFDMDSLHLTVRGSRVGEAAGRFAEAELAHVATVRAAPVFDGLEMLWGQKTGWFYLVLAPSSDSQAQLAETWKSMGQTRPDFRIHLSLGRFSPQIADDLVPGYPTATTGEPTQQACHALLEVIADKAGTLEITDSVFGLPHLAPFALGTPLARQCNLFPIYLQEGWQALKQEFVLASSLNGRSE